MKLLRSISAVRASLSPRVSEPTEQMGRYRDVQSGTIRAAVFGISDGLVTNVSLILGVAGADVDAGVVRLAGLAGMVAGAFSMFAGEFVSMSAQRELLEREIRDQRETLATRPAEARRELESIFIERGISADMAEDLSREVMRKPEVALDAYARAGLGVDPQQLGSPVAAGLSSFFSFCIGGIVPLLPWFFLTGNSAVLGSILLGAISALTIGAIIGVSTGRSPVNSSLRQLALGATAGGSTYLMGTVLGVQIN